MIFCFYAETAPAYPTVPYYSIVKKKFIKTLSSSFNK